MQSNVLHTSWESLVLHVCAVTAGSFLLGILPVCAATPFAYDIPPYTGQRYTDRVPDTLDLAERARLSLNALTRPVDPHRDYSLYFLATWNQNPPVLRHEAGSDDCLGKFIGPQVLNRIVSGSDANLDLERLILEHAYLSDPPGRVLCRNGASARVLEGFILRYLRDHNPGWKAMVRQAILDESGGGLTVNLLLNRAARKADLYSYLPYEGRLDLHVKQPCATADGVPRKAGFSGRYAQIGPVAAGVTITLRFANPTTNVTQTVCSRAYHCTLRGNTVVRIDPPGVVCPLYDRQAMMASTAPTISVTRLVSDETKFLDQNDLRQRAIAKPIPAPN